MSAQFLVDLGPWINSGVGVAMLVVLVQLKTDMRHVWRAIRRLEENR
jgi:hypothetical protein